MKIEAPAAETVHTHVVLSSTSQLDDQFNVCTLHKATSSSAHLDESGQHETQIHIPAQGGQIKQQAVINQATCVPAKPQATKASYMYMYMYALDRGSIAVTC